MEVEIPEGGTVRELLAILGIPEKMRPVVVLAGRVLKEDDRMCVGSSVSIFEPVHGG
jgi:sulfur carrier protein ThiS